MKFSSKTARQKLATLKKANHDYRIRKAKKEGFASVEKYMEYLRIEAQREGVSVKAEPAKAVKKTTGEKPLIHIVDIIDCSGSMSGTKIQAANKGIFAGLDKLKEDKDVNYTYMICDFSYHFDIKVQKFSCLEDVDLSKFTPRGATALYDAIGKVFGELGKTDYVKKGDKVLINIYTDGAENDSKDFSAKDIAKLIEETKDKGYTVTFIGTEHDVHLVTRNLKVDITNTLAYDGTGAGLDKALATNSVARSSYSKKVSAGEDVSLGFYKDLNTKL